MIDLRRSVIVLALFTVAACVGKPAAITPAPGAVTHAPASPAASAPGPTPGLSPTAAIDVRRIPLSGSAPDAIALDGDVAWVLTGEGGTLLEVSLTDAREVRAIDVGFGPTHIALPAPGLAAIARFDNSGTGTYLPIVDLESGTLRPVSTGELRGLAAGDSGIAWAIEAGGRMLRVDTAAATVTASSAITVGQNVHIEIQWGAGAAWVGSDGLPTVRVDGADLDNRVTIDVPTGIPFLFEGGVLWGAGPTALWAINPATNEITRRVDLENVSEILALDIDGDDAWLAVRRTGRVGAVLRLDLRTGELRAEYPVSLPAAVRLAPDRAWVASYETNELLGFAR